MVTSTSEDPEGTGAGSDEATMVKFAQFCENIDFKFEYLFSIMIACLIVKLMELILFSSEIGPLV